MKRKKRSKFSDCDFLLNLVVTSESPVLHEKNETFQLLVHDKKK